MINYIVTAHNSGSHISHVLDALFRVRSEKNPVYVVLDGCTDNTEEVVSRYPVKKLYAPDLYEMRCINLALKEAAQNDGDLNCVLQDDVVLEDRSLELKLTWLNNFFTKLGLVGLRHGCNLMDDTLTNGLPACETDKVENEHNIPNFQLPGYKQLKTGWVTGRQIVYKSPVIIPCALVNAIGVYDEQFSPTAHDDTEYSIRAVRAGFHNMIAAIPVRQPMEWRGSNNAFHIPYAQLHKEHMDLIRLLYADEIIHMIANKPSNAEIRMWPND